jgi:ParB family chromosome partitioning protein
MAEPTRRGGATGERPAEASEAQRRLSDVLQTRVRVETGPRKGRIVVDFTSVEELQRIVAVMAGDAAGATARVIRLD